jgi:UDP-N-acetylmuramoyl-L-alanyl-D-glutamate--2,6-diaminopimelate ligase
MSGSSSTFTYGGREVRLPLGARFNVANALAAAAAVRALGVPVETIAGGLSEAATVAGRFEVVADELGFPVVVDYAHTPAGLDEVLASARLVTGPGGRVLVVFGCGGNRDSAKRRPMGAAATAGADIVVVTTDNPRGEDPLQIIREVRRGCTADAEVMEEPDRREAISLALARARPGDVVVIAGKGHERTQELADRVVPFDDREVARQQVLAAVAGDRALVTSRTRDGTP